MMGMNKTTKAAKAKMEWACDMRAREVVIGWLQRMGKKAPDKKLRHMAFATEMQAIIEPQRAEARFVTKKGAVEYVREIAKMVDGRDLLDPPKAPPLHVQKWAHEKKVERQQRVSDAKRKASRQRIEAEIVKADREIAERMAARRAEMQSRR
jgi:hypothetical protein